MAIVEKPDAKRGYEGLLSSYESMGMSEEAECVRFLISEKFDANGSSPDQG